jgi:xanthine dehydrogenase accessory factor
LSSALARLDFASAAVLVFHEHEKEPDILHGLVQTDCYYIGALGNHAVHRDRLAELSQRGVSEADLRRIRAPVGSIPGAKSKATFAIGVLTEMMAEAKANNLIS